VTGADADADAGIESDVVTEGMAETGGGKATG
jgi:hypothetical protein